MARRQSRRTISISRHAKERLERYADSSGVAMGAIVEFLVERQLGEPLDKVAFDAWRLTQVERVRAAMRSNGLVSTGRPRSRSAEVDA